MLARAYTRRKQFEARMIAVEVGRMLVGDSTPRSTPRAAAPQATRVGKSGKVYHVVSPEEMLGHLSPPSLAPSGRGSGGK